MKHPFSRLLLATEHTEFDQGAEQVAFTMAARCGLPLHVILPVVSNPEYEVVAPHLAAQAERDAAAKIAELTTLAASSGVCLVPRIRRGEEPWREIVAEARDCRADLLITRRRGKRGLLANLLVGEMVSKVVGHAPCSVLMVPRSGKMWSNRILAAVDRSEAGIRVAVVSGAVADQCGLPLTLVSVAVQDSAHDRAQAEAALARALTHLDATRVDTRVAVGRAHENILLAASDAQADLIVLGRRGESGIDRLMLGGTAQKVIGLGDGPVLVVTGT